MKNLSDEAIVIGLEEINLEDFPKLKVIGCNCTGLDHLPWEQIQARGVKVISLRDYPEFMSTVTSTAEHTIGLILALFRCYKTALNEPYKERDAYMGHTLADKTLGIIGYGRVGGQLEKIAKGFGMSVLLFEKMNTFYHDLSNVVSNSDIISLHIPLDNNEGFFTKEMFGQMKPTAYFVNTSRSKVVEDGALLFALKHALIQGAAVDFTDDPDLLKYARTHDNLILTNHVAGNTSEDRHRTEEFITQKVMDYLHV